MKKLALLLLAFPLAACVTPQQTAAGGGNCDPHSYGYEICVAYNGGLTRTSEHNNTARDFPSQPFAGVPAYVHFEPYQPH